MTLIDVFDAPGKIRQNRSPLACSFSRQILAHSASFDSGTDSAEGASLQTIQSPFNNSGAIKIQPIRFRSIGSVNIKCCRLYYSPQTVVKFSRDLSLNHHCLLDSPHFAENAARGI